MADSCDGASEGVKSAAAAVFAEDGSAQEAGEPLHMDMDEPQDEREARRDDDATDGVVVAFRRALAEKAAKPPKGEVPRPFGGRVRTRIDVQDGDCADLPLEQWPASLPRFGWSYKRWRRPAAKTYEYSYFSPGADRKTFRSRKEVERHLAEADGEGRGGATTAAAAKRAKRAQSALAALHARRLGALARAAGLDGPPVTGCGRSGLRVEDDGDEDEDNAPDATPSPDDSDDDDDGACALEALAALAGGGEGEDMTQDEASDGAGGWWATNETDREAAFPPIVPKRRRTTVTRASPAAVPAAAVVAAAAAADAAVATAARGGSPAEVVVSDPVGRIQTPAEITAEVTAAAVAAGWTGADLFGIFPHELPRSTRRVTHKIQLSEDDATRLQLAKLRAYVVAVGGTEDEAMLHGWRISGRRRGPEGSVDFLYYPPGSVYGAKTGYLNSMCAVTRTLGIHHGRAVDLPASSAPMPPHTPTVDGHGPAAQASSGSMGSDGAPDGDEAPVLSPGPHAAPVAAA